MAESMMRVPGCAAAVRERICYQDCTGMASGADVVFLNENGSLVKFSILVASHQCRERGDRSIQESRMPIPATCPSCNTSYQLADTMRGKRVRCKSCSEVFDVRDEDALR